MKSRSPRSGVAIFWTNGMDSNVLADARSQVAIDSILYNAAERSLESVPVSRRRGGAVRWGSRFPLNRLMGEPRFYETAARSARDSATHPTPTTQQTDVPIAISAARSPNASANNPIGSPISPKPANASIVSDITRPM